MTYDRRPIIRASSHKAALDTDKLKLNQAAIDRAAVKLNTLVKKYANYQSANDSVGGAYHGHTPVRNFRSGTLEVLRDTWVPDNGFNRQVVVGLKIGSNWYPMPPEANKDAKLRSDYYAKRRELLDKMKREADTVLQPLIKLLNDAGVTVFRSPMWVGGTSWSGYFIGG